MGTECVHGMDAAWCAICTKADDASGSRGGEYGFHGGRSKQDALDAVCDQLGIDRQPIGASGSLPSGVFDEMAVRVGVPRGSMPSTAQAVAEKAGLAWGPTCDSRGSASGGGSTVTVEGLGVLERALALLLPRWAIPT